MIVLETPTILRLPETLPVAELRRVLTFKNKAAQFELSRFKKNRWFVQQHGEEAFQLKIDELKKAVDCCLLQEDDQGAFTYPGLLPYLKERFKNEEYRNNVQYPGLKTLAYEKIPEYDARYYQVDGVNALLEARHGAVEIGTGLGKSVMIEILCRHLGHKTLIMAPSKSIAGQLYKQLVYRFGGKRVGLYGDGKKKSDKLITVGIAASLTKIKPGSEAWKDLSKIQVFIADESHLCPAETLTSVCTGLAANAPYRFFFSGTQLRADGAGMLLDGITGPIVYRMTVKEGVDQEFLAKPNFFMHRLKSPSYYQNSDHMRLMGPHWYKNPVLAAYAADLANKSVSLLGHPTLILIEHVDQFQYLLPHLRHDVGFAHGGLTAENKGSVDPRFHKSDPDALVEQFNRGELPILVGTSCISTGTDIRSVKTLINLQAGKSEVKIRQAVGRGTRRVPGKTEYNYHDFFVKLPGSEEGSSLSSIERHAIERSKIMDSIYGPVRWIG